LLRYNTADWERKQRMVWKLIRARHCATGRTPVLFETLLCTFRQNAIMNGSPEDERLAASGPRVITLYTRPGCHLCEEAKALIEPLLSEFGAALREVNIDEDAVLRQRYGTDIPVIFIGSRKVAKHRVDPVRFRRQLGNAV
jgi:glutaredoxin